MAGKSILQRIFDALQLSVDANVNCELTPRQCKELLQREELLQSICDQYQEEIKGLRVGVPGMAQEIVNRAVAMEKMQNEIEWLMSMLPPPQKPTDGDASWPEREGYTFTDRSDKGGE